MRVGGVIIGFVVLAIGVAGMWACSGDPPIIETDAQKPDYKKNAMNANRYLVEKEETNINAYISRRQWEVEALVCGARVHRYAEGMGSEVANGDTVELRYSVELLSGATIYSDTVERVVVGHLQPCEGVDAALQRVRRGTKMQIVLPSSAAFGVPGDHCGIPPRSAVVYDIKEIK